MFVYGSSCWGTFVLTMFRAMTLTFLRLTIVYTARRAVVLPGRCWHDQSLLGLFSSVVLLMISLIVTSWVHLYTKQIVHFIFCATVFSKSHTLQNHNRLLMAHSLGLGCHESFLRNVTDNTQSDHHKLIFGQLWLCHGRQCAQKWVRLKQALLGLFGQWQWYIRTIKSITKSIPHPTKKCLWKTVKSVIKSVHVPSRLCEMVVPIASLHITQSQMGFQCFMCPVSKCFGITTLPWWWPSLIGPVMSQIPNFKQDSQWPFFTEVCTLRMIGKCSPSWPSPNCSFLPPPPLQPQPQPQPRNHNTIQVIAQSLSPVWPKVLKTDLQPSTGQNNHNAYTDHTFVR